MYISVTIAATQLIFISVVAKQVLLLAIHRKPRTFCICRNYSDTSDAYISACDRSNVYLQSIYYMYPDKAGIQRITRVTIKHSAQRKKTETLSVLLHMVNMQIQFFCSNKMFY